MASAASHAELCPPPCDRKAAVVGLAVAAVLAGCTASTASDQGQPVGFQHQTHVQRVGLQCIDCHSGADVRDAAMLPSLRKCMLCHEKVGTELPEVAKLAGYWERRQEVPWVRTYGFERRAAVRFRHAAHFRVGVSCGQCHGDVASMGAATAAVEHTMGTCVSCHRETGASDDCAACHY